MHLTTIYRWCIINKKNINRSKAMNLLKKAWNRLSGLECFEGTYQESSYCDVESFSPKKTGFLAELERFIKSVFLFLPAFYLSFAFFIWYIFSMIFPEWIRIPGLQEPPPSKKRSSFLPLLFISSLIYCAFFGAYMLFNIVFKKIMPHN